MGLLHNAGLFHDAGLSRHAARLLLLSGPVSLILCKKLTDFRRNPFPIVLHPDAAQGKPVFGNQFPTHFYTA